MTSLRPRPNIDTVGEFDVLAMSPPELPWITLHGVVQASLDASPAGRGRQNGEFANSITVGSGPYWAARLFPEQRPTTSPDASWRCRLGADGIRRSRRWREGSGR